MILHFLVQRTNQDVQEGLVYSELKGVDWMYFLSFKIRSSLSFLICVHKVSFYLSNHCMY